MHLSPQSAGQNNQIRSNLEKFILNLKFVPGIETGTVSSPIVHRYTTGFANIYIMYTYKRKNSSNLISQWQAFYLRGNHQGMHHRYPIKPRTVCPGTVFRIFNTARIFRLQLSKTNIFVLATNSLLRYKTCKRRLQRSQPGKKQYKN